MWASRNHKLLCGLIAVGQGEGFIMGEGMLRLGSVAKPHCIKAVGKTKHICSQKSQKATNQPEEHKRPGPKGEEVMHLSIVLNSVSPSSVGERSPAGT